MSQLIRNFIVFSAVFSLFVLLTPQSAMAADAAQIDREARTSLEALYASSEAAKGLAVDAKGILVFTDVIKAGLIIGAQYGDGALLQNGKTIGYYNTVAASYGLQAGAQSFGYALFFMTEKDLSFLTSSSGWEIGVGPNIVVVEAGAATAFTTTTARDNVYAFFFDQKGLMAGLGLQGSKITKINPDK